MSDIGVRSDGEKRDNREFLERVGRVGGNDLRTVPEGQSPTVDWALKYVRRGWPVIPLRGKVPLVERGSLDCSLDEDQVRGWWEKWPDANVGLATGHRFFAVDLDIKGGGEDTWDELRMRHSDPLTDTTEQVTGTGGRHILFALPDDFTVLNSQRKLGPGIDVRGKGGYIVAAPSIHPETKLRYAWDGDVAGIAELKIAPAPAWLLDRIRASDARKFQVPEIITAGSRNDTLFKIAVRLRHRIGYGEEEIFTALKGTNRERCEPPLEEKELRSIARSAARYETDQGPVRITGSYGGAPLAEETALTQRAVEAGVQEAIDANDLKRAVEWAPDVAKLRFEVQALIVAKLRAQFGDKFPTKQFEQVLKGSKVIRMPTHPSGAGSVDLLSQPLTDAGNAERFVAMFGSDLRFCTEMDKWLLWDGKRWKVDTCREVRLWAKRTAREFYAQATGDEPKSKWARLSEMRNGISAMIDAAIAEPGVSISASALDQHPYLLNCPNGVIDLRTGQLLSHDRELLITKLCYIPYDPAAQCPRFIQFLEWAMGQNEDAEQSERTTRMLAYLQRAFGYSLTADVSEKCAFVFWGEKGNNGKTPLLDTFRRLLPEYTAQITIDALMTNSGMSDTTMRADLADLRGARMAVTSEVEKEHKLSVALMKRITSGGAMIKSCRKYENPIEFPETHKLFMDCNHRPRVSDSNNAIWRRLKLVAFPVSIEDGDPKLDKDLKGKLLAEGPGILAWCVQGAIQWAKLGLDQPAEVLQAVQEWKDHDDPLAEFQDECCDRDVNRWVQSSTLYGAYVWWVQQQKHRYWLSVQEFSDRLRATYKQSRSRRDSRGKTMRTWEGIGLKSDVATEAAASEGRARA